MGASFEIVEVHSFVVYRIENGGETCVEIGVFDTKEAAAMLVNEMEELSDE